MNPREKETLMKKKNLILSSYVDEEKKNLILSSLRLHDILLLKL